MHSIHSIHNNANNGYSPKKVIANENRDISSYICVTDDNGDEASVLAMSPKMNSDNDKMKFIVKIVLFYLRTIRINQ